jgi:hypothetical protein
MAVLAESVALLTKTALPAAITNLIADAIFPNWTALGVAFFVSSSALGIFKAAQLSSPNIQYREDDIDVVDKKNDSDDTRSILLPGGQSTPP